MYIEGRNDVYFGSPSFVKMKTTALTNYASSTGQFYVLKLQFSYQKLYCYGMFYEILTAIYLSSQHRKTIRDNIIKNDKW